MHDRRRTKVTCKAKSLAIHYEWNNDKHDYYIVSPFFVLHKLFMFAAKQKV